VNRILLLALPIAIALGGGCQKEAVPQAATASGPSEPVEAQPKLQTMNLWVGPEEMIVELALTPDQEMTGMMFRTNIQETDAMLFVLPVTQQANFWMKNCPESISAAYITPNGVIAEIHHLEQNDTNGVKSAGDNIRFVLETKEGWFTRHNISPGTVIATEKGSLAETFLQGR